MMRHLRPIVSTILFTVLISIPAGARSGNLPWQPSGYGGGGRFTAIAVDRSSPQTVYVGSDVAGVYRSRDGGHRFQLVGKGLGGFAIADLAVNPAPPHQLFALTDDGLYYSTRQGDDWIRITGDIRYPSRYFGSTLLLFKGNALWIGTDTKGVFKLPLDHIPPLPQPVPGLERFKVNGLALYDGYVYAGTSRGPYRWEGHSWKPQQQGLPQSAVEMTDIAASGKSLYIVEKKHGLFRWHAAAALWEGRPVSLKPTPKSYKSLLVHPDNPDLLFLGSHPEDWPHLLYKSQDGGSSWKSLLSFQVDREAPPNWTGTLQGIEEMAFVPGTSRSLFLADWWNLWKSSDDGDRWHQKHHGLQNTCVNDLKIHPRNPKVLYLCTWDNGLMISDNSGRNWRRAMSGVADGHAQEIEISRNDPSRMVLLVNPWGVKGKVHLYESRNAGTTWRDIGFSVPAETLPSAGYVDGLATNVEMDPFSDDTLYVGTNGYGVYKTTNGGRTWSAANQGLSTPFIKGPGALRVHPRLPRTLFASTQAGGIYKSTDGAESWQRVTSGERFTFGMDITPSIPSRIVAGSAQNTLLISYDEGKNWQERHLPVMAHPQMAVVSAAFHPLRPGVVMAGTHRHDGRATEGLFISTDGAKTFRHLPMDIPAVNISVITPAQGEPVAAYIGFIGTGIFRVLLGEQR